jgi:hypothetical protein
MADEKFYNQQIGAAYWYVTHKQMIKTIVTVFLSTVIIIFAALNLYLLIFNLGIYGRVYNNFLNSLITAPEDYQILRLTKLPQALKVGQISNLQDGSNFDIIAEISNPNKYWYATFKYQLKIGSESLDLQSGFILPGQSKKLINLNIENGNQVNDLVVSDVNWIKEINFPAIEAEKMAIEIKNISLIPPAELGVGDKLQVSRVKFDVINNSPFNYANVILQIYLLKSGQIQAVSQISSGVLRSGQTQTYQVDFFQTLPKINETPVIIPEINILDPKVFLKF